MADVALEAIERESVTEKVTAALRTYIISGVLKPGTRLVESQLAEQLHVSRAPVREAFRVLEPEGLVVSKPGKGTFVAEISVDDVIEIYTLRSVLERLAVRLAVERITKEDLAQLSHILERMEEAASRHDAGRILELSWAFHEAIWKLSGHRRLQEILSNMIGPIRMIRALKAEAYDALPDIPMKHVELLEALSSGDVREAEKVMTEHIAEGAQRTTDYLRKIGLWDE